MKFSTVAAALLVTSVSALEARSQWYPLTREGEIPSDIEPYTVGQEILMDCISRNIDNGEHMYDDQKRIIYSAFPKCKETGKPLTFKYGQNDDIQCTIGFTDELYHLFQLYIHEDVPFSCRLPLSTLKDYLEKGGAYIPLTFNFRGEIHDSHLDIDPSLNVIITKPSGNKPERNSIISAVAWSSGTNATRVVIGDYMTINLAVRWYDKLVNSGSEADMYDNNGLPYPDGFYKLPMVSIPISYSLMWSYILFGCVASAVITIAFGYRRINKKITLDKFKSFDSESSYAKKD